jgi:heme A synthase
VLLIVATTGHVLYHHRRRAELRRPSTLLLLLLPVQITLGAITVLGGKPPVINSLHVVTGASILVTSLVLALRAHRFRFGDDLAHALVREPRHLAPRSHAGARA